MLAKGQLCGSAPAFVVRTVTHSIPGGPWVGARTVLAPANGVGRRPSPTRAPLDVPRGPGGP